MSATVRATHIQNLNGTGQNGTNGKAGVVKIILTNNQGAVAWVQIFDALAANVTIGTTVPLLSVPLAATVGVMDIDFFPGWIFQTRCLLFATTADEGNTGSNNGVMAQVWVE